MLQSQWVTVLGAVRSGDSSSGQREDRCGCVSECSAGMCCFWCDPFYSHCLSLGLQVGTILIHISVTVPAAARHRECSRGDRATGVPSPPARYVPWHSFHRAGWGRDVVDGALSTPCPGSASPTALPRSTMSSTTSLRPSASRCLARWSRRPWRRWTCPAASACGATAT